MGSAASNVRVDEHVGTLGKAYEQYIEPLRENGVDAELIHSIIEKKAENLEFKDVFDEIGTCVNSILCSFFSPPLMQFAGITNKIHSAKLMNEGSMCFVGPSNVARNRCET